MKQNKEDFEKVWEQKVKELQTQLNLARGNNVCTQEEMKENKVRIKTLMVKVSDLENTNLALNQKIADFVQTIDNIKSSHRSEMNVKEEEMQRLLEQLNHQQKEYQKLQVCVGNEIFKKIIVFKKIGIFLLYILICISF